MPKDQNIYQLVVDTSAAEGFTSSASMEVETLSSLRHLPGRRSVWHACIKESGQEVLLKVYDQHPKQTRDSNAEWENACLLKAFGVNIADPLFLAKSSEGEIAVGFHFIKDATDLNELVSERDANRPNSCSELFAVLLDLHAREHNAGCFQKDNHLGNYLWGDGVLYALDAGSFVFEGEALMLDARVQSLAMLAANVPLPARSDFLHQLEVYLNLCPSWINKEELERALAEAIPAAVRTRRDAYAKKTRRSCTEFVKKNNKKRTWLACKDLNPELKKTLLKDPDSLINEGSVIKKGNTCTVAEVKNGDQEYILKRYNQKPFIYRLSHTLLTPRAQRSWTNGHVLRLFGIRTPRPLACLMIKSGAMLEKAYLLMEKIPGTPLNKADRAKILADQSQIPKEFAKCWNELDQLQVNHGDMKASNFMVDEQGRLSLIDLDGMELGKQGAEHERQKGKDMARFMRNWAKEPEVAAVFKQAVSDELVQ